MKLSFIVIDDSELDCFIARKIIEHTDKGIKIQTFQDAQLALEAIKADHDPASGGTTIILLDIQMPLMNGFEFVEAFEKLPAEILKNCMVVILSSTRNPNDIFRLLTYPVVHSHIEKPFTREKLFELILQLQSGL